MKAVAPLSLTLLIVTIFTEIPLSSAESRAPPWAALVLIWYNYYEYEVAVTAVCSRNALFISKNGDFFLFFFALEIFPGMMENRFSTLGEKNEKYLSPGERQCLAHTPAPLSTIRQERFFQGCVSSYSTWALKWKDHAPGRWCMGSHLKVSGKRNTWFLKTSD